MCSSKGLFSVKFANFEVKNIKYLSFILKVRKLGIKILTKDTFNFNGYQAHDNKTPIKQVSFPYHKISNTTQNIDVITLQNSYKILVEQNSENI